MTGSVQFGTQVLSMPSKVSMKQDAYSMSCQFDCETTSYSEIAALVAYTGPAKADQLLDGYVDVQTLSATAQKQTLIINGTSYPHCVISEPLQITERLYPYVWTYTVKFVQSTAG